MPGTNQLPAGSEGAAAISLIWASVSWACSSLLLWLTWSHHEGWSYLSLLAVSSTASTTFSIAQQIHDITCYVDVVTEAFERKIRLPADDPELAIANGSFGADLVLYYCQYYLYSVQAMLVMFWAAELCQLTYQLGERRTARAVFRKLHTAGKLVSWLLPLVTILMLRIPPLKECFVAFILIADLPLMISLAIGSGLMIAVLIRYVRTRQRFTQWSPQIYNSGSNSQGGTATMGTQDSSDGNLSGKRGLYDRWLMVRFTLAFVSLAIFECTNTIFQVTALQNNMKDSRATAPDLSTSRAVQTFILFMPGTTPGIFIFVVFGTTASSRKKLAGLLIPKLWRGPSCRRRSTHRAPGPAPSPDPLSPCARGITVKRSITVQSTSRPRAKDRAQHHHHHHPPDGGGDGDDDLSDLSDRDEISMQDLSTREQAGPAPRGTRPLDTATGRGAALARTDTDDSLRALETLRGLGAEHSDDSGLILPIQTHEALVSCRDVPGGDRARAADWRSGGFLRPKR